MLKQVGLGADLIVFVFKTVMFGRHVYATYTIFNRCITKTCIYLFFIENDDYFKEQQL